MCRRRLRDVLLDVRDTGWSAVATVAPGSVEALANFVREECIIGRCASVGKEG